MKRFLWIASEQLKNFVRHSKLVHFISGSSAIFFGMIFYLVPGMKMHSIRCVCWAGRVIEVKVIENFSIKIIKHVFLQNSNQDGLGTRLHQICTQSDFLKKNSNIYSITPDSKVSFYRDLIILKEKNCNEKGVVLIKYTPAFDAFNSFYDLDKILQDHYIVLEPSWAGACDPSFLMFWRDTKDKSVIVQTIEPRDFEFIKRIGGNMLPISLGSSDWTDSCTFTYQPEITKQFDLIVVSNWGLHKNHRYLFNALRKIKTNLKVVLVGFPWCGRTIKDIEADINMFNLKHNIDLWENIPPEEVSVLLNKSKVFLLLSRKEGGNKAIVEAFFSNVPAILYDKFIGGVQAYINENTGVLSSFKKLSKNIEYMFVNYHRFTPRKWIEKNSGSSVSTNRLDDFLKEISRNNGQIWINKIHEKVNSPNLRYKNPSVNINTKETLEIYAKN